MLGLEANEFIAMIYNSNFTTIHFAVYMSLHQSKPSPASMALRSTFLILSNLDTSKFHFWTPSYLYRLYSLQCLVCIAYASFTSMLNQGRHQHIIWYTLSIHSFPTLYLQLPQSFWCHSHSQRHFLAHTPITNNYSTKYFISCNSFTLLPLSSTLHDFICFRCPWFLSSVSLPSLFANFSPKIYISTKLNCCATCIIAFYVLGMLCKYF